MSSETVYFLLPEITLVLMATLVYLGGAFLPHRHGWGWFAAASLVLAGVALYQQGFHASVQQAMQAGLVSGPVAIDFFSQALRFGILGVGLIFVMLSTRFSEYGESSEVMGSLLAIIAGLMLLALADDLVLIFVALELVSIPTYVLLFLARGSAALESGTKYFFLSLLASAILLYGFSFLYGAAGSTSLSVISQRLTAAGGAAPLSTFARLALVLIFAGLGFRLTIVPFHFYAPDVYQGTTHPNAGLLAVVPKIAGFAALVRIALATLPGSESLAWRLALPLAIVTMTIGNVLALRQHNVRRLLAYSSVAHGGYMLIGLAVGFAVLAGAEGAANFDGIGATLFYLLVYAAATAGTFAALTYLSTPQRPINTVEELAGLATTHPKTAGAIAVFMFSLTGLPPLAGFWGKFSLFTGALSVDAESARADSLWPWFLALAIVGALNAAISAAYYLRIVGVMYFKPSLAEPMARGGNGAAWATAMCTVLVIGLGCFPGTSLERANRASRAARATLQSTAAAAAQAQAPTPAPAVEPAAGGDYANR